MRIRKFKMTSLPQKEPIISVGLLEDAPSISFDLAGEFKLDGAGVGEGAYRAYADGKQLCLVNQADTPIHHSRTLHLVPLAQENTFFSIRDVKIGKQFHWERLCNQMFSGELCLFTASAKKITAINKILLESYLESVISSEMSPENPVEFLKAHCICSRSWLLHQLNEKSAEGPAGHRTDYRAGEIISWTGREAHKNFDVCADDHCQRYQGIGRINGAAKRAVQETRGEVLTHNGQVCDTRYSKCCGGITENFSTAWEDEDIVYLTSITDAGSSSAPVSREEDARRFILSQPAAYCNIKDKNIIKRILPDFDCETRDFFRWTVDISQQDISALVFSKTGVDFGAIKDIVPLARGASGRLFKIKLCGTKQEKIIGKELEIRRILSPTHLLSSAFVVEPRGVKGELPDGFRITGAGWGHGVGLCQIGAAGMAEHGTTYREILSHYFKGAQLTTLY